MSIQTRASALLDSGVKNVKTISKALGVSPERLLLSLPTYSEVNGELVVKEVNKDLSAVQQREQEWEAMRANLYSQDGYRLDKIFNHEQNKTSEEIAAKWGVSKKVISQWARQCGLFVQSRFVWNKENQASERRTVVFTKANTLKAIRDKEDTYLENAEQKEFTWHSTSRTLGGYGFSLDTELEHLEEPEREQCRQEYWLLRSKTGLNPRSTHSSDYITWMNACNSVRGN